MLVLTRKEGQKIYIGGGITVTLLDVKGARVRLGIEAPEDVRIARSELVEFAATCSAEPAERESAF